MRDLEGIAEMMMPATTGRYIPAAIGGGDAFGGQRSDTHRQRDRHAGRRGGGRPGGRVVHSSAIRRESWTGPTTTHVHDEWTRKKFDEGKYKSSEIYGSPRDPALRQEYQDYLKKRLEEIRKSNGN